jgi:hypothetical protein
MTVQGREMIDPYKFLWRSVLQMREPFTCILCRQILFNGILFWATILFLQWYFITHYLDGPSLFTWLGLAWLAFDAWLLDHLVRHITANYTQIMYDHHNDPKGSGGIL